METYNFQSAAVSRESKEAKLRQRGCAIWLYGLSGAGKTTLARALESRLAADGYITALLDGDDLRAGLNRDLGFDEGARRENLRRAAEVAKHFIQSGVVTICAFITPAVEHRRMIRSIVGADDLIEVYLAATVSECAKRDPKGLYARARSGAISQFTGVSSAFEPPGESESPLVIESGTWEMATCVERLLMHTQPRIKP